MSLQVVDGGAPGTPGRDQDQSRGRALAPGAPRSPGPLPLELAEFLRTGEVVIWWDHKDRIDLRPIGIVAAVLAGFLAVGSLMVPQFWSQPFESLWPPLAALASPVALLLVREAGNRRAIVVTDTSVLDFPRRGSMDRIGFDNVGKVRRSPVFGGVVLEGKAHRVRIPPSLAEDARQAIATQRRGRFQDVVSKVNDPMGWLS